MSSSVGIDLQEKKIIQNASEVVPNVSPHQDCLRHCPKWLHIGNKHNSQINSEIVARNVFYRYVCRKIIQNASEVVSKVSPHPDCHWDRPDCVRHGPKWQYIGHKNNRSGNLPEVYFATMLSGDLSKMRRQSFRMFSHLQIASWPKMAIHRPQK